MKAFLSYSHRDSGLVDNVADLLGRQFCHIDKHSFQNNEEFIQSINDCIEDSDIYVLFGSRNSLRSYWVNFEIETAFKNKINKLLSKIVVYVIDEGVSIDEFPEWLKAIKIPKAIKSSTAISKDIKLIIDNVLRSLQHDYFVGRQEKISEIQDKFVNVLDSRVLRKLFVVGLTGIGRRSLLKKAIPDILAYNKFVEFPVKDGDSLYDLCFKLASKYDKYNNISELILIREVIKSETEDQIFSRINTYFDIIENLQHLLLIVDDGGVLDEDGNIQDSLSRMLNHLETINSKYIMFVTNRTPNINHSEDFDFVKIEELSSPDIKRLIRAFAHSLKLLIPSSKVDELTEYVAGYPPSVYYALKWAKDYGIDSVLANKQVLVQFRLNQFVKMLKASKMTEMQLNVLQLLNTFHPLPLPVIAEALNLNAEQVSNEFRVLTDNSLVIVTETGLYRVPEPIKEAITSICGYPTLDQASKLRLALEVYIEALSSYDYTEDELVLGATLHKLEIYLDLPEVSRNSIVFNSNIIELIEELYHNKDYNRVITLARSALLYDRTSIKARSFLIRSLIQTEDFLSANQEIDVSQGILPNRQYYFLRGFYYRVMGDFNSAIIQYKESLASGRKDVALFRELADCCYMSKNFHDALDFINRIPVNRLDNDFILDIAAKIHIALHNEDQARNLLERLRLVNTRFYYHRLSRLEFMLGHIQAAKIASEHACEGQNVRFENIAQLLHCEILLGNSEKADTLLKRLDSEYRRKKTDIRYNLEMKNYILKRNYRAALTLSDKIRNKETKFFSDTVIDAIQGVLSSEQVEEHERLELSRELSRLQSDDFIDDVTYLDQPF